MYVKKLWQTEWERYPGNKLYKIQPKVNDPIPTHGRCRREETILCRLDIGHTFKTHFYLLKGEEPPVCIPCDQLCSIEHLLTGCVDLIEWRGHFVRQNHWVSCSVSFLRTTSFSFLKCTNLFNKCYDTIVHLGFITVTAIPFSFFFFYFVVLIVSKTISF